MSKIAIFTMDVEGFYNTECIINQNIDKSQSMSDGIYQYLKLLKKYDIKGDFFVIANDIKYMKDEIKAIIDDGHQIGLHGLNHLMNSSKSNVLFRQEIKEAIKIVEDELGVTPLGYRAPCFSLNRSQFQILSESNLKYDSSFMNIKTTYQKPVDFPIELLEETSKNIYKAGDFYEFPLSTRKNFTVSGGAYLRLCPYWLYKNELKKYLKENEVYVFYVHPFELSEKPLPLDLKIDGKVTFYLKKNRGAKFLRKIEKVIKLLKRKGFEFKSFEELI